MHKTRSSKLHLSCSFLYGSRETVFLMEIEVWVGSFHPFAPETKQWLMEKWVSLLGPYRQVESCASLQTRLDLASQQYQLLSLLLTDQNRWMKCDLNHQRHEQKVRTGWLWVFHLLSPDFLLEFHQMSRSLIERQIKSSALQSSMALSQIKGILLAEFCILTA